MKYTAVSVLVVFAVLEISCATRPGAAASSAGIEYPEMPAEIEPAEPFERALWNVKKNTALFRKYIDGGADGAGGSGIENTEDIQVKGECVIDGKQFRVTYNLIETAQSPGGFFRTPFFMENLTDGVSASDALYWSPLIGEAGLLLSLDDDYWHTWPQFFDVFDQYGAKVTFFVRGSLEPGDGNAAALEQFCTEALKRGHDLGFHTVSHYNLLEVSRRTFDRETAEGAGSFSKAGIPFSAFAFPFGLSESWMREALSPVFPLTRGYGRNARFYAAGAAGGYIISKAVDNIIYPDDCQFENAVRLILLAAKLSGSYIAPLTTHDISDTAPWAIKPSRLEFLLKTAQELKLKFYTYRDMR